jgi:hypothetical protein
VNGFGGLGGPRSGCEPAHVDADNGTGRQVLVNLDTLTSADVRTLLALVLEREARDLKERCERIARADELLSRPTIGAYRQHTPEVHPPGIDL